ncbi:MAG: class I SAM-dependent methyltransferase [Proteobacteria bacterium]|nr:class I SAM-dependent methyltransferase [Desulfobacula sp.]MBU3950907.1 class I SAM-dependent methyltransferase [Pseudomonadota bacterium]MBU4131303.1 class I SAM-dependent methyltransferase [Pseudomonadota bacterium]
MEQLTDWFRLWEQLSDIQSRAFERQREHREEDFWKHKARQFDKMVEDRWAKPDSSRDFLVEKFKENPGSTLLDIGAGTGKWSLLVAPHASKVTALEPSSAMQQVLREKILGEQIANIEILTGTWPEHPITPHDYVLASHSMYGVKDFRGFVDKMTATATRACILLLRAPLADAVMAKASLRVFGQPYDSPNFQVAYNMLLAMDIYPDVIMEADGTWPDWTHPSFEEALADLKNRLDLGENREHDTFLSTLLEKNLSWTDGRAVWPSGNRSALVYWEVG